MGTKWFLCDASVIEFVNLDIFGFLSQVTKIVQKKTKKVLQFRKFAYRCINYRMIDGGTGCLMLISWEKGESFGTIYSCGENSILSGADLPYQDAFAEMWNTYSPGQVTTPTQATPNGYYPSTIHPLGPYYVQSIGAAKAVSWAIGYNPGWVATLMQDTRMAQSSQQAGTHFCRPRKDDRLSEPHLVLIQRPSRIWTQDPNY